MRLPASSSGPERGLGGDSGRRGPAPARFV